MAGKTKAELEKELAEANERLRTMQAVGAGAVGPGSLSEQGAQEAQRVADSERAARQSGGIELVNPNGMRVRQEVWIDHLYLQSGDTSIFADPSRFMRDVRPDCMYVWAAKKDAYTWARIRSGAYRPVEKAEIRDDTDVPIETHVMAGKEYVAVFDVLLMEVPPDAVRRLYKHREAVSALRAQNNMAFKDMKARIEGETGGIASAELEVKDISYEA